METDRQQAALAVRYRIDRQEGVAECYQGEEPAWTGRLRPLQQPDYAADEQYDNAAN
jgi:hypothetical protein